MNQTERLMRQPPQRRYHEDIPRETVEESREWWMHRQAARTEELRRKQREGKMTRAERAAYRERIRG